MRQRLTILLFTIFFPIITFALTPTQQLTNMLDKQKSMRANFVQTVTGENDRVIQKTTGSIAIQRPGKFYWESAKPTHQILVADGKKLWIYDVDLQQVTVRTLKEGIGNTPALLLTGNTKLLSEDFKIEPLKSTTQGTWFKLIPKTDDTLFENIKIQFVNDTLKLMVLSDSLGQTTTVDFVDVKINPSLPADLFEFTPPKGVDVIGN